MGLKEIVIHQLGGYTHDEFCRELKKENARLLTDEVKTEKFSASREYGKWMMDNIDKEEILRISKKAITESIAREIAESGIIEFEVEENPGSLYIVGRIRVVRKE